MAAVTNIVSFGSGQTNGWLLGLQPGTNYTFFIVAETGGYFTYAPKDSDGVAFNTQPAVIRITSPPAVSDRTTNSVTVSWGVENTSTVSALHTVLYTWTDSSGNRRGLVGRRGQLPTLDRL